MSSYIDQFLSLNCATDILEILRPIQKVEKEISEAMAIISHVRKIALKNPGRFEHIDLCSGNAIIPTISAFLFPVIYSYAVDKRQRKRDWDKIRKFCYVISNISEMSVLPGTHPKIVTACHACTNTAVESILLFRRDDLAKYLILLPCCEGVGADSVPDVLVSTKYKRWCEFLRLQLLDFATVKAFQDERILSPKNILLVAEKLNNKDEG